ncbi:MAG: thioredoxin domain-containing protein [Cyanobacteria bacterium J06642_9]
MTADRLTENLVKRQKSLIAIAVVVIFAIAAVFLTRPQTSTTGLSPVSGLITLKASAQSAISYDLAIANGNPTLVEFYADWCTTCQALAPALQAVHRQFGSDLNLVMLNIDDPQWRSQIQQFRVSGVPHLVLLNPDQAIVDSFIGDVPRQVLASRIEEIVADAIPVSL